MSEPLAGEVGRRGLGHRRVVGKPTGDGRVPQKGDEQQHRADPLERAAHLPGVGATASAPDWAFMSMVTDMTNLLVPVIVLKR